MPNRSEILEEVRKADPRFVNVPDDELATALAKKYPSHADALMKKDSGGSTFEKITEKARGNLALMNKGESGKRSAQAEASATQDIKNYYTRAIGETAAMAPFLAAAPLTSGTSVPAGMAIMGGLGLAGGVARETVKKVGGSSEVPKGWDLALALGADAAVGAGGEALGRFTGLVGKTLIPKLIESAASKSDAGKLILENMFSKTRQELYDAIGKAAIPKAPAGAVVPFGQTQTGSVFVDIERPLREAYDKIGSLPRAAGHVGQRFSGMTPKAAEVVRSIEQDLLTQGGSIGQMQPLDGLIRVKGNLQQMAFRDAEMNAEERTVFKKLAADLHEIIKKETRALGPETEALYKKSNDLGITLNKAHIATGMAEKFVQSYVGRATLGAGVGGAYGGYMGRTPGAAATGAAAGVGAAIAVPRLSALILQQTMSHPKASKVIAEALESAIRGERGNASILAARAFAMAGVRETVKEAIKQQGE